MKPAHFASAAGFRRWLQKNHATKNELLVGWFPASNPIALRRNSGDPK
jgi:hypothetical protein